MGCLTDRLTLPVTRLRRVLPPCPNKVVIFRSEALTGHTPASGPDNQRNTSPQVYDRGGQQNMTRQTAEARAASAALETFRMVRRRHVFEHTEIVHANPSPRTLPPRASGWLGI